MHFRMFMLPCAAALAILLQVPDAGAQSLTAEEVRVCLCQEQALKGLRQDLAEKRSAYDGAKARLDAMQREIDTARASMDPNDQLQVQLLAEQIQRRDQARAMINRTEYPALQSSIGRLNAVVAQYNQQCADRPMRRIDIEMAQRNLQCPAN